MRVREGLGMLFPPTIGDRVGGAEFLASLEWFEAEGSALPVPVEDSREEMLRNPDVALLKRLLAALDAEGFRSIRNEPSYLASDCYRSAVRLEDFFRRLYREQDLIFSEGADPRLHSQPSGDGARRALFRGLTTTGVVSTRQWEDIVPADIRGEMAARDLTRSTDGSTRLAMRFLPTRESFICCDVFDQTGVDTVHVGRDSILLAGALRRSPGGFRTPPPRILDLGCGSGIHSVVAGTRSPGARIHCVDINDRALAYAKLNMRLNDVAADVSFCRKDWREDIPEGPYDLILFNPPFEFASPASQSGQTAADGGGRYGLGHFGHVMPMLPRHLAERGTALVVTNTPVMKDGRLFLADQCRELSLRAELGVSVEIGILFEHIFAGPELLDVMKADGIRHFAVVVVAIRKGAAGRAFRQIDARPLYKRLADAWRVRSLRSYYALT